MQKIICWKTGFHLWDYAAGRLPEAQRVAVAEHLAHCAACERKARQLQRTTQAIQADRALLLPDYANRWPAVEAGLEAAEAGALRSATPGRFGWQRPALAFGGLTLLCAAVGYVALHPAPHHRRNFVVAPQLTQGDRKNAPSQFIVHHPTQRQIPAPQDVPTQEANAPFEPAHTVSTPKRTPVIADSVYLDGRDSASGSLSEAAQRADGLTRADGKPLCFRDDFVSVAPPMLAGGGTQEQQNRENAAAMREYERQADVVDTRLFRKITLQEKGESVETVCTHIQTQTGVKIQGARDVQDEKLTVFVKDVPARDVLRAIARLFRYAWRRAGDEGKFHYTLSQDLRSQFDEEEMRNRDTNAALLALDDEMKKRLRQGEKQKDWSYVQLYDQLTPTDRLTLRSGASLEFDPDSPQPERQVAPEIQHLLLPEGADFHIDAASDDWLDLEGKRGVPYSKFPGTRVGASFRISHSELGQMELQGTPHYSLWLPKIGKSRLGIYGEFPQILATGKNPSSAPPNNAKANAALAALPLFQRKVTLQTKHLCHGQRLDKDDDPMTPHHKVVTVEDMVFTPKVYFRQHIESADVWEEIHKKTGMPIVADCYSRLYPAEIGNVENKSLFEALCRTGDALGVKWKKDGDFLLGRSASYFWDKLKEVPRRLLDQWGKDSRNNAGLPLEDFLEMANCTDTQLDSMRVAQTMFDCWGLNEWERVSIARDGRMDSIFGGPEFRTMARYLANLPPNLRAPFFQPDGCDVETLTPIQQQELNRILEQAHSASGSRVRFDYVPAGRYVWNPTPGSPFTQGIIALHVVSGKTPEEALTAAQKIDPSVTAAQIHATRSVFAITVYQANGPVWVRGTPGETMTH